MQPQTVTTITPGNIEQTGIASILKTFLYTVAGAFFSVILATLYHYDFGTYEAVAMILLPTLFKVIEKFFFAYNITVTDPINVQTPQTAVETTTSETSVQ